MFPALISPGRLKTLPCGRPKTFCVIPGAELSSAFLILPGIPAIASKIPPLLSSVGVIPSVSVALIGSDGSAPAPGTSDCGNEPTIPAGTPPSNPALEPPRRGLLDINAALAATSPVAVPGSAPNNGPGSATTLGAVTPSEKGYCLRWRHLLCYQQD